MNFERTLTTDISSDFMQFQVGWGVPLTQYLVCHRQTGHFNKLKKLSYTLVGDHTTYIYTMACNSNAAAAIGSWFFSKNNPHQTIRAHME